MGILIQERLQIDAIANKRKLMAEERNTLLLFLGAYFGQTVEEWLPMRDGVSKRNVSSRVRFQR